VQTDGPQGSRGDPADLAQAVPMTGERAAPHGWLLMAVLVTGHAVKHLFNAGFFVLLPEIRTGLGLSNAAVGTLSTARTIAGSMANLPAGFVADRYSREWAAILALAMAVIGLFQFVMGSVSSYGALLLASTVVGGAVSFWHPPAIAALSQRFAQRRGLAIALHGTGGNVGEASGPLIVGALLLLVSWQTVLKVSLLPALATGLLVIVLVRHMQGQTSGTLSLGSYLDSVRRLLKSPALLVILGITGLYSMVQVAVLTFLPIYIQIDLGYPPFQMTAFIAAAQVAGIASQPLLGFLSDRFGRRAVLAPSLLCLGTGVLATGLVPAGWPLAVTVTAMGAFQFPLMALFLASAIDVVGAEVQATTVSLVFGISTLFGSFAPALAGALADVYGLRTVFVVAAGVAALAAGVTWLTRR
jgi:FSR family fosmidomycin resistance protein-like MFS transporter